MSVHYKFKSALDFDTISFDGLHISVDDLKKAIIHQKRLGKTQDFDLQITNAQTKEGKYLPRKLRPTPRTSANRLLFFFVSIVQNTAKTRAWFRKILRWLLHVCRWHDKWKNHGIQTLRRRPRRHRHGLAKMWTRKRPTLIYRKWMALKRTKSMPWCDRAPWTMIHTSKLHLFSLCLVKCRLALCLNRKKILVYSMLAIRNVFQIQVKISQITFI